LRAVVCLTLTILILLNGLLFVSNVHVDIVQGYESVSGIITSDTTWTKANSPYTLTGPLCISAGVTSTIEAGATVNLGSYYIMLNGTLNAQGSNSDKIYFNGANGEIRLRQYTSPHPNSLIEDCIFNGVEISIWNTSVTINNNYINGKIWIPDGSPSTVISNNIIVANGYGNAISGGALISNNIIKGGVSAEDSAIISNNTIEGEGQEYGVYAGSNAHIFENIIYGFQTGIRAYSEQMIEKNLIFNNNDGILMHINANPTIQYNTIVNNFNGVTLPGYSDFRVTYHNIQVNHNNIYNNTNYNICLGSSEAAAQDDVNATHNWWGTIDTQMISQKIHDDEDDFSLGAVTFEPFLTEPNPKAPVEASVSGLTPTSPPTDSPSTPAPSQEPGQAELTEAIIGGVIVAVVLGAGLGLLFFLIKRK